LKDYIIFSNKCLPWKRWTLENSTFLWPQHDIIHHHYCVCKNWRNVGNVPFYWIQWYNMFCLEFIFTQPLFTKHFIVCECYSFIDPTMPLLCTCLLWVHYQKALYLLCHSWSYTSSYLNFSISMIIQDEGNDNISYDSREIYFYV